MSTVAHKCFGWYSIHKNSVSHQLCHKWNMQSMRKDLIQISVKIHTGCRV